jgi:hypothetical protein
MSGIELELANNLICAQGKAVFCSRGGKCVTWKCYHKRSQLENEGGGHKEAVRDQ